MMICYVRMIHSDGEDKNMTNDDLKALVADLAIAQKVTDEQMKRTDEKLERMGIR